MYPVLTYVDTRNAKDHGKIAGQTPAENLEVMLNTEVNLNVFRYPTDKAEYNFRILLNDNGEDARVRITIRAENSDIELEAYDHIYPPDLEREQPVTINLPDERKYTCTVYLNGEASEPFEIGN